MTGHGEVYDKEKAIDAFFAQASTDRQSCDLRAQELAGDAVVPVQIQDDCSYSVYAGPTSTKLDTVVQFRLKSLPLSLDSVHLAQQIWGSLVPDVTFHGQIGEDEPSKDKDSKEALNVFVSPRVQGATHLDSDLAKDSWFKTTPENHAHRLNLISDCARFFATAWKSPQQLDGDDFSKLQTRYRDELEQLLHALPARFHLFIEDCSKALPSIMALPKVLTHSHFSGTNLIVDPQTYHLVGVIDWADATIEPFGVNLFMMELLMGHVHKDNGYARFDDYDDLQSTFWDALEKETKGWHGDGATRQTVKMAVTLGLLLHYGFTPRLGNMPKAVPIPENDEKYDYNMRHLDSWLIDSMTKLF